MRSFFGLALGGVGCASRAGRVAIGLERKVSPPTPRRKIGRLLNRMRGGASNPPPTAPNHNIRGHLLGGSLSRGPIVGGPLLRGPILALREHRLHVFCVFFVSLRFYCMFSAAPSCKDLLHQWVGRRHSGECRFYFCDPSPMAIKIDFSGEYLCFFNFDFGKPGPQEAPIAIGGRR